MALIFFLLFLAFFFPFLFYPLLLFVGLFLIFIPLKFTVDSFFNLFFIPGQIYKIATNTRLRKNHALEHATVNILERDYGYRRLSGYATEDGFYIIGAGDINNVVEAAGRGLLLMRKGQSQLAVHKNCGTSRIVDNFVSAIIFLGLLFTTGQLSIFNILIALLLSHFISPFLGRIVQSKFTTQARVQELEIEQAYYEQQNIFWGGASNKIFVETKEIPFLN